MTPEQRQAKRSAIWKKYYYSHRAQMLQRVRAYREANREKLRASRKAWRAVHYRKCQAYGVAYREARRAATRAKANARRAEHTVEMRATDKAYRLAHPDQMRQTKRAYRAAHQEVERAARKLYLARNKDKIARGHLAWARANPGTVNAITMKRWAAKLKATPPWSDLAAIAVFYDHAADMTRSTGIRHEVDHIIPLQNTLVCGLHVACNLQVLTKADNIRKHNRFKPHTGQPL